MYKQIEVNATHCGCGRWTALEVANIERMSGEICYKFVVNRSGGIWYLCDWTGSKWNPIGDKALEKQFPDAHKAIFDNVETIKAELEKLPLNYSRR